MKRILSIVFLVFPLLAFGQTTWQPTSSDVSFKIKNAGITVTGHFSSLKADMKFSPDKLSSSHLKASVEVATLKTGIKKRDKDLQDDTYFNADKYKLIEVESVSLEKKGSQYSGFFKVTIKGVTKQVEIPFDFKQTGNIAEFTGAFTINRRDYGVGGKTLTMSDDATVNIDIKAKS